MTVFLRFPDAPEADLHWLEDVEPDDVDIADCLMILETGTFIVVEIEGDHATVQKTHFWRGPYPDG